MVIDQKEFSELLAEASGHEKENIQQQLQELISEIKQAISDNDAFEIEGLGMFSGLGNRILFIPSKRLETEVNYKYVGMEPIELDEEIEPELGEPEEEEENPIAGMLGNTATGTVSGNRNPFAGLVEDFNVEAFETDFTTEEDIFGEETEIEPSPDHSDLTKEIETQEETVPSGVLDEPEVAPFESTEEMPKESPEMETELMDESIDPFLDFESDKEETVEETEEEKEDLSSINDEILGRSQKQEDSETVITEENSAVDIQEEDLSSIDQEIIRTTEEEDTGETEIEEIIDDIIIDELDGPDPDEEEQPKPEKKKKVEEIIPVITNLSSDIEKPVVAEKTEKKKPAKLKRTKKNPSSVLLWGILVVLLLFGAAYALTFFNVITIPGITSKNSKPKTDIAQTQAVKPLNLAEKQPLVANEIGQQQTLSANATDPDKPKESGIGEQAGPVSVSANNMAVPENQPVFGLMGVPSEAGNDGYTIVVHSLRSEERASSKQQELAGRGYRALLIPIQTSKGVIWRVSLGQFRTITEAAIASDDLDPEYIDNFFIKKIK